MSEKGNVGIVDKNFGVEDYSGVPPEYFVGKWVKKRFTDPEGDVERLWIRVTEVADGRLVGVVDNDPVYDVGVECGDSVTLSVSEVIGVYE